MRDKVLTAKYIEMRGKILTAKYIIPHFDQKRWSEAEPLAWRNLTPLKHANAFPLHNSVKTSMS